MDVLIVTGDERITGADIALVLTNNNHWEYYVHSVVVRDQAGNEQSRWNEGDDE